MSEEFSFRAQNVDYLGFLEAQLRDLAGTTSLAYEFIQNADDVRDEAGRPQASSVTFDVTDEALIIENDGEFRPVDFERLQQIASGGKRDEAGTTGAFGIGFVVVYLVTDRPEIFSGGRHWVIRPEAVAEERILERKAETTGTRFLLPWATAGDSEVRRALRLPAWQLDELDRFAAQVAVLLGEAALFLRQLTRLTVKRNGKIIEQVTRTLADDELILQDVTGARSNYLLLHGNFAEAASGLKSRYQFQIEDNRNDALQLAIPLNESSEPGRLFAGLPTEERLPLAAQINADFFPTTDRKRLQFAAGFQAEWNEAALTGAAAAIANNLPLLRDRLSVTNFWNLLQQLSDTAAQAGFDEKPTVLSQFWQLVTPQLAMLPIFPDLEGRWGVGAERILLKSSASRAAASLLSQMGLAVVDINLAEFIPLMSSNELGCNSLTLADVIGALRAQNLTRPQPLFSAPTYLRDFASWRLLWGLIDELLKDIYRPDQRRESLAELSQLAIVVTERMWLSSLRRTFRGNEEVQSLFVDVNWLHPDIDPLTFPGNAVTEFNARQGITYLRSLTVEELESAWRAGRLDIELLFRWFEGRQIEILVDDMELIGLLRRLPLMPIDGELRPLESLFIPGGFNEPLGLAALVDLRWVGGRRQFLQDLGTRELDFDTYIYELLPRALRQDRVLPADGRHQLLQLLARRLGEFRDDYELQADYAELPLIPCLDGSFRAGATVYLDRQVMTLLGEEVAIAEPVESGAMASLYEWLGVRSEPHGSDLIERLLVSNGNVELAQQLWLALAERLDAEPELATGLARLVNRPVIPTSPGDWLRPEQCVLIDDEVLAGRFATLGERGLSQQSKMASVWVEAGVQPLTTLSEQLIDQSSKRIPRQDIAATIVSRAVLIQRLAKMGQLPDWFATLTVNEQSPLQMRHQLTLADQQFQSEPQTTRAIFVADGELLIVADTPMQRLWPTIGRELAVALTGGEPAGTLALGLREILAAENEQEAEATLQELGLL